MFSGVMVGKKTPTKVLNFIESHVDIHLCDVHAMLRLPLHERQIKAGCNFAISVVLLNVISGISATLYNPGRHAGSGKRFKYVATNYYPWDVEPANAIVGSNGSDCLYNRFRNPLAHDLGSRVATSIARWQLGQSGRSEDELREIETAAGTRPVLLQGVATLTPGSGHGQEVLNADCLYWGVRELVRRFTEDPRRMRAASKWLAAQ